MLDAAHGEGVRPVRGVQGVHLARTECQVAGVRIAGAFARFAVFKGFTSPEPNAKWLAFGLPAAKDDEP